MNHWKIQVQQEFVQEVEIPYVLLMRVLILLLILPNAPQSLIQSTTQSTDLPCSKDELLDPLDSKPGDFIIVGIFNVGQVNTHTQS